MRSNSLDIQLKKTEKELKQNEQEIADQQQLHELTVKELELTKAAHKIAQEECQQHKNKVCHSTTCSLYPRRLVSRPPKGPKTSSRASNCAPLLFHC